MLKHFNGIRLGVVCGLGMAILMLFAFTSCKMDDDDGGSSTLVLYDDLTQGDFNLDVAQDSTGGGRAGFSLIESTEKIEGDSSISIDLTNTTGTWGGAHISNAKGVDASSYANIVFSINTSTFDTKSDPYLQIKLEDMASKVYTVDLFTLTGTKTSSDKWKTYSIKLTDVTKATTGFDFAKFKGIGFWNPKSGGESGTYQKIKFYVDDVKFTK